MTRLMQTTSALTLAAALAAFPAMTSAQQASESQVEQAVENAAQETGEAVDAAAEAVGEAAEAAGETVEQAGQEAARAVDQATTETEEVEVIVLEPKPAESGVLVERTGESAGEATVITGTAAGEEMAVEGETMEPMAETVEGTIRMQDENSILSSDLVGATVFNPANEEIGEIDDAILSLDGMVDGVVIGVGGFLGLGEKDVAIEMQQLSVRTDENGKPQLFLDTTKEALESAPEFVTVENQRDEAARAGMEAEPAGGLSTSDTAPAEMVPPAPADEARPVQN